MPRRAADHLVDCLADAGADRLFCVPGESYLALLDALHGDTRIDVVTCRHEGGAGMMAVADAKLTGRAGLLAVSRGPGATNASIALHLAEQDAVPLLALIGQVARHERGRGAFQEVDYTRMLGGICKAVVELTDAARIAETVARLIHVAESGTPGPVALILPEDLLSDTVDGDPLPVPRIAATAPSDADVDRVATMLAAAERPLVIAGGGLARPDGRRALADLARAHGLPVATTFKHQEIFDNADPLFAGHLGFKIPGRIVQTFAEADLILAIGTRLGDVPTQGWRIPRAPVPDQPVIHVWPDPAVLGRVVAPTLGLACNPVAFARALAARDAVRPDGRAAWAERLRAQSGKLTDYAPKDVTDGLDFGVVAAELARQAPRDAIVATDAGNFSGWIHALWPWDGTQDAIGAAGGAMGLAVPGAVAAALRHPDRMAIAVVGDGGLMMTGNELAAARARGIAPRIVVSDNGTYGTIRMHQERDHPGRVSGTDLANPDFAAWAASFGALGLTVGPGDDVAKAVARLLAHDGPALLSVRASAEAISAQITLTALRARAATPPA